MRWKSDQFLENLLMMRTLGMAFGCDIAFVRRSCGSCYFLENRKRGKMRHWLTLALRIKNPLSYSNNKNK